MPLNRCFRVFQILGLFYVAVAVLYATNFLLVSPLCTAFSLLLNHWSPRWSIRSFLPSALSVEYVNQHYASHTNMNVQLFLPTNEGLEWSSSGASLNQSLAHNHDETASMPQDLFLSKAFSNSMRPTKVIPYFYRASGTFDRDDITITTLITSNRFLVFSRLVERYQGMLNNSIHSCPPNSSVFCVVRPTNLGPISVTIHVRNTTAHLRKLLDSLRVLYASSITMSTFVDVHLVVDSFDRQFNTWRNIARLFARTDFILMLDIDFSVCTDFRTAIRNDKKIMNKLREGRSAFVIPAFEYTRYAEGMDQSVFPRDKPVSIPPLILICSASPPNIFQTLMKLVNSKHLGMFHASWVPGHNSTDYKRYYAAPPGDVYKVSHYQSAYEPYVVFKKEGPPWYLLPSSIIL